MDRLRDALQQLEAQGIIEKDFCNARTESLFAQIAKSNEQNDSPKSIERETEL